MLGTPPLRTRSIASRLRAGLAACGCAVVIVAAAAAGEHPHVCPGPGCEPNCPVRPAHFGHYTTQWRRWPGTETASGTKADAATPAAPPKSVVPGSDEESPRRPADALPAPATDAPATDAPEADAPAAAGDPTSSPRPAPTAPQDARLDRGGRLAEVAREFEACRAGPADRQAAFTHRLVAYILSEPDPGVRSWFVQLAAEFETADATAIWTGALEDPDPRVRMAACTAAARRGDARAVQLLADRVRDDEDLGVRLRALRALGDLDQAAAPAAVAAVLDDPDPAIRARALDVLRRRSGRDFGDDVAAWRAWADDPQGTAVGWSPAALFRRLF
jgi:hypothetical protein